MDFEAHDTLLGIPGYSDAVLAFALISNFVSIFCCIFLFVSFFLFRRKDVQNEMKVVLTLVVNDLFMCISNIARYLEQIKYKGSGRGWNTSASCQFDGFMIAFTGMLQFQSCFYLWTLLYKRVEPKTIVPAVDFKLFFPGAFVFSVVFAMLPLIPSLNAPFARYDTLMYWCYVRRRTSPWGGVVVYELLPLLAQISGLLMLYGYLIYKMKAVVKASSGADGRKQSEFIQAAVKRFIMFPLSVIVIWLPPFTYLMADVIGNLEVGSRALAGVSFLTVISHGIAGVVDVYIYGITEKVKDDYRRVLSKHPFFGKYVSPPVSKPTSHSVASASAMSATTSVNSADSSSMASSSEAV